MHDVSTARRAGWCGDDEKMAPIQMRKFYVLHASTLRPLTLMVHSCRVKFDNHEYARLLEMRQIWPGIQHRR
jgi:hypothetical protein